uniref:Uncharacterized protein n=1 Tax=Eutreptiella gymnastica TaxID=73025 RepID=A0A7S4CV90_9EUGL
MDVAVLLDAPLVHCKGLNLGHERRERKKKENERISKLRNPIVQATEKPSNGLRTYDCIASGQPNHCIPPSRQHHTSASVTVLSLMQGIGLMDFVVQSIRGGPPSASRLFHNEAGNNGEGWRCTSMCDLPIHHCPRTQA